MARWAGEGNDWIKFMAQRQLRKEDVIHSLLVSMRRAVEKKTESNGTRPAKKPRELPPSNLKYQRKGRNSPWTSKVTAKRLWTGSMAMPS